MTTGMRNGVNHIRIRASDRWKSLWGRVKEAVAIQGQGFSPNSRATSTQPPKSDQCLAQRKSGRTVPPAGQRGMGRKSSKKWMAPARYQEENMNK